MQIRELLSANETRYFVGREKELQLLEQICFANLSWNLLYIHGPAGIGKTTLLKRFMELHDDRMFLFLSGIEGYIDRFTLLEDIWEEIKNNKGLHSGKKPENEYALASLLNQFAEEVGELILILDCFELWSPLHKWLRDKWLPLLSTRIRIILSSRFKISDEWMRSLGWGGLIQQIELGLLKKDQIFHYAKLRGIVDSRVCYQVEKLSLGFPFILRTICDVFEVNDGHYMEESLDERLHPYIFSLTHQILSASTAIIESQILFKVASLVQWFDYELIHHVLEEKLSPVLFTKLCQLPYIEISEHGGWKVKEVVRHWIQIEFSLRSPHQYQCYQARALKFINHKLHTLPDEKKLPYFLNSMGLIDINLGRSFGLTLSNHKFTTRVLQEEDFPVIRDMFKKWIVMNPSFYHDRWNQEQYLYKVWKIAPASFIGVCLEKELIGFLTFVPLDEQTRPLFAKNPIYASYIKGSTLEENEYTIWCACTLPEYDPEAIAFIFQYYFAQMVSGKLITTITPFPEVAKIFKMIGFKELSWCKVEFTNHSPIWPLQLDVRNKSIVLPLMENTYTIQENKADKLKQLTLLVKEVFINLHLWYSEEHYHKANQRLSTLIPNMSIAQLKKKLLSIVAGLNEQLVHNQQRHDHLYGRILDLAFIQKCGTHDSIALRLNLSTSTYYRYLKKSYEKMAQIILEEAELNH